jgi:hypothetical protein
MSNVKSEIRFLSGPQSRWEELSFIVRVMFEFVKGFRVLHFAGPCVTFFGSAKFDESHPYYSESRHIARRVAQLGFTVMTGGGPGLMEAANRGAKEVGGRSVGCNIALPVEQVPGQMGKHPVLLCAKNAVDKIFVRIYRAAWGVWYYGRVLRGPYSDTNQKDPWFPDHYFRSGFS